MAAEEPTGDEPLCIGDKVQVQLKEKLSIGELKFIGKIKGKPKLAYGVELKRKGDGKNSGGTEGQDYFPCAPQKGVFLGRNKILKFKPGEGLDDRIRYTFGDKVFVAGCGAGTIRYMGFPQFQEGMVYGIELEKPNGRSNGTVDGIYYFTARNTFGTFATYEELSTSEPETKEDEEPAVVEPEVPEEPEPEDDGKDANDEANAEETTEEPATEEDATEEKVVEEEKSTETPVRRTSRRIVPLQIAGDSSMSFIPAQRSDALLKFIIRQPNAPFQNALFDMYAQSEGRTLLAAAFPDLKECGPEEQLGILNALLHRFPPAASDYDFPSMLTCTPFGCTPDGYTTEKEFRTGLNDAYADMLAVKNDDELKPTIPPAFLDMLPVVPIDEECCAEKVSWDEFVEGANTGDFILFASDKGLSRLIANFTNAPFTQVAFVVKGNIETDEGTYGGQDHISLVFATAESCIQTFNNEVGNSDTQTIVAAESLEYLQQKKANGEACVLCKLEADDADLLADVRNRLLNFAASNVGSAARGSKEGFPAVAQDVLRAMLTNNDPQMTSYPSSGLMAAALQSAGVIPTTKAATSFVPGSFSMKCAGRVGFRNGPYPSLGNELYDGINIVYERCFDYETLPE